MTHAFDKDEIDSFVRSARAGDSKTVRAMLAAGLPPDALGNTPITALHAAASEGQVAILRVLLDAGADPNWYIAGASSNPALIEIMSRRRTALLNAVASISVAAVETLLDAGADPRIVNDERSNSAHLLLTLSPFYLQRPDGSEAFARILRRMLDAGVNPDHANLGQCTLLHLAVAKDIPLEVVELLLERGAQISERDADGLRPIHAATQSQRLDIVDLLVRRGANVDSTNSYGDTALASARSAAAVQALVQAGADVDARNTYGDTALSQRFGTDTMNAEWLGVTIALIEAGADLDLGSYTGGATPRQRINDNAVPALTAYVHSRTARAAILRASAGSVRPTA